MINRIMFTAMFVVLFGGFVFAQQIEWLNDLDAAQKLAQQTGKPLMYDFTASWCGPCRRMDRDFWPRPEVVALSRQFVCVKVDFDKEKALASRYNIKAIPNVVFTDPWGRGLLGQRGFGAGTDKEIFEKINILPKDFSSLKRASEALEKNGDDIPALHEFASFYQERKFFWLGNHYYNRLQQLEAEPTKRESILLNLAFNSIRLGEASEAIEKLEALQKEYPTSGQNDLYIYGLILAHSNKKMAVATRYLGELKQKFPRSKYVEPAETHLAGSKSEGK